MCTEKLHGNHTIQMANFSKLDSLTFKFSFQILPLSLANFTAFWVEKSQNCLDKNLSHRNSTDPFPSFNIQCHSSGYEQQMC